MPRSAHAESRLEFDRFVRDSADGLLRAAFLITWDAAEAEDLVQESLFRVARRWPRVRKMDHPTAYARTVLVHLALDEGKRRTRRRAELEAAAGVRLSEQEDDSAVQVIGRVEANADLLQALGELPPRQRVALVLRYFEDLSEADVAAAMGCSVGTVKSTTSRALDRLRQVVAVSGTEATASNGCGLDPSIANGNGTNNMDGRSVTTHGVHTNEGSVTR